MLFAERAEKRRLHPGNRGREIGQEDGLGFYCRRCRNHRLERPKASEGEEKGGYRGTTRGLLSYLPVCWVPL